jgi:streptomycin 6-kinase
MVACVWRESTARPGVWRHTITGVIEIPRELVASLLSYGEESGRAVVAMLPGRAAEFLDRWELRLAGPSMYGRVSLVLPVVRPDGARAVLKLQQRDEETEGEWLALRTWAGDGAVRLLEHDAATGTLLLVGAPPAAEPAGEGGAGPAAVLCRGRQGGDGGAGGAAGTAVGGGGARGAAAAGRHHGADAAQGAGGGGVAAGDLHFGNVLTAEREPWLVIDPKPLVGDPGFELLPALWDGTGGDDVLWRFDLMTEVLGLDRERARAWTLGRVLQNSLWRAENGRGPDSELVLVTRTLLAR